MDSPDLMSRPGTAGTPGRSYLASTSSPMKAPTLQGQRSAHGPSASVSNAQRAAASPASPASPYSTRRGSPSPRDATYPLGVPTATSTSPLSFNPRPQLQPQAPPQSFAHSLGMRSVLGTNVLPWSASTGRNSGGAGRPASSPKRQEKFFGSSSLSSGGRAPPPQMGGFATADDAAVEGVLTAQEYKQRFKGHNEQRDALGTHVAREKNRARVTSWETRQKGGIMLTDPPFTIRLAATGPGADAAAAAACGSPTQRRSARGRRSPRTQSRSPPGDSSRAPDLASSPQRSSVVDYAAELRRLIPPSQRHSPLSHRPPGRSKKESASQGPPEGKKKAKLSPQRPRQRGQPFADDRPESELSRWKTEPARPSSTSSRGKGRGVASTERALFTPTGDVVHDGTEPPSMDANRKSSAHRPSSKGRQVTSASGNSRPSTTAKLAPANKAGSGPGQGLQPTPPTTAPAGATRVAVAATPATTSRPSQPRDDSDAGDDAVPPKKAKPTDDNGSRGNDSSRRTSAGAPIPRGPPQPPRSARGAADLQAHDLQTENVAGSGESRAAVNADGQGDKAHDTAESRGARTPPPSPPQGSKLEAEVIRLEAQAAGLLDHLRRRLEGDLDKTALAFSANGTLVAVPHSAVALDMFGLPPPQPAFTLPAASLPAISTEFGGSPTVAASGPLAQYQAYQAQLTAMPSGVVERDAMTALLKAVTARAKLPHSIGKDAWRYGERCVVVANQVAFRALQRFGTAAAAAETAGLGQPPPPTTSPTSGDGGVRNAATRRRSVAPPAAGSGRGARRQSLADSLVAAPPRRGTTSAAAVTETDAVMDKVGGAFVLTTSADGGGIIDAWAMLNAAEQALLAPQGRDAFVPFHPLRQALLGATAANMAVVQSMSGDPPNAIVRTLERAVEQQLPRPGLAPLFNLAAAYVAAARLDAAEATGQALIALCGHYLDLEIPGFTDTADVLKIEDSTATGEGSRPGTGPKDPLAASSYGPGFTTAESRAKSMARQAADPTSKAQVLRALAEFKRQAAVHAVLTHHLLATVALATGSGQKARDHAAFALRCSEVYLGPRDSLTARAVERRAVVEARAKMLQRNAILKQHAARTGPGGEGRPASSNGRARAVPTGFVDLFASDTTKTHGSGHGPSTGRRGGPRSPPGSRSGRNTSASPRGTSRRTSPTLPAQRQSIMQNRGRVPTPRQTSPSAPSLRTTVRGATEAGDFGAAPPTPGTAQGLGFASPPPPGSHGSPVRIGSAGKDGPTAGSGVSGDPTLQLSKEQSAELLESLPRVAMQLVTFTGDLPPSALVPFALVEPPPQLFLPPFGGAGGALRPTVKERDLRRASTVVTQRRASTSSSRPGTSDTRDARRSVVSFGSHGSRPTSTSPERAASRDGKRGSLVPRPPAGMTGPRRSTTFAGSVGGREESHSRSPEKQKPSSARADHALLEPVPLLGTPGASMEYLTPTVGMAQASLAVASPSRTRALQAIRTAEQRQSQTKAPTITTNVPLLPPTGQAGAGSQGSLATPLLLGGAHHHSAAPTSATFSAHDGSSTGRGQMPSPRQVQGQAKAAVVDPAVGRKSLFSSEALPVLQQRDLKEQRAMLRQATLSPPRRESGAAPSAAPAPQSTILPDLRQKMKGMQQQGSKGSTPRGRGQQRIGSANSSRASMSLPKAGEATPSSEPPLSARAAQGLRDKTPKERPQPEVGYSRAVTTLAPPHTARAALFAALNDEQDADVLTGAHERRDGRGRSKSLFATSHDFGSGRTSSPQEASLRPGSGGVEQDTSSPFRVDRLLSVGSDGPVALPEGTVLQAGGRMASSPSSRPVAGVNEHLFVDGDLDGFEKVEPDAGTASDAPFGDPDVESRGGSRCDSAFAAAEQPTQPPSAHPSAHVTDGRPAVFSATPPTRQIAGAATSATGAARVLVPAPPRGMPVGGQARPLGSRAKGGQTQASVLPKSEFERYVALQEETAARIAAVAGQTQDAVDAAAARVYTSETKTGFGRAPVVPDHTDYDLALWNAGATKIQAAWRRVRAVVERQRRQRKIAELLKTNEASGTITRAFRRRQSTAAALAVADRRRSDRHKVEMAAVIQRFAVAAVADRCVSARAVAVERAIVSEYAVAAKRVDSAVVVQAAWRGWCTRRERIRQRRAVGVLQRVALKLHVFRLVAGLVRAQRTARAALAKRRHEAAAKIQHHTRLVFLRRAATAERQQKAHEAGRVIEDRVSAEAAFFEVYRTADKPKAVATLHRSMRANLWRCRETRRLDASRTARRAAIRLQCFVRRHIAKRLFAEVVSAALERRRIRIRHSELREAAVDIQRGARGMAARREARARRQAKDRLDAAARVLQTFAAILNAKRRRRDRRDAEVKDFAAERRRAERQYAATKVQAVWRRFVARAHFVPWSRFMLTTRHELATRIQSSIRRALGAMRAQRVREQRAREVEAARIVALPPAMAVVIQRAWRNAKVRAIAARGPSAEVSAELMALAGPMERALLDAPDRVKPKTEAPPIHETSSSTMNVAESQNRQTDATEGGTDDAAVDGKDERGDGMQRQASIMMDKTTVPMFTFGERKARHTAAAMIQRAWRSGAARDAAYVKAWTDHDAREAALGDDARAASVVTIQRVVRGRLLNKSKVAQRQEVVRDEAAKVLQRFGHMVVANRKAIERLNVIEDKREVEFESEGRSFAAARIQALVRGVLQRQRQRNADSAATKVQATWRMHRVLTALRQKIAEQRALRENISETRASSSKREVRSTPPRTPPRAVICNQRSPSIGKVPEAEQPRVAHDESSDEMRSPASVSPKMNAADGTSAPPPAAVMPTPEKATGYTSATTPAVKTSPTKAMDETVAEAKALSPHRTAYLQERLAALHGSAARTIQTAWRRRVRDRRLVETAAPVDDDEEEA